MAKIKISKQSGSLKLGTGTKLSCDRCAKGIKIRLCQFCLDALLNDMFEQGVEYGKRMKSKL